MDSSKLIAYLLMVSIAINIECQMGVNGKVFTRCQLAKELVKNNISRTFLSNWICLVENESGRDTAKVTTLPNTSSSYGIFQINSKLWCRSQRKGGLCNMKCESFLDDDITDDVRCATQIFNMHGFRGWTKWTNRCLGHPLPDVSQCR